MEPAGKPDRPSHPLAGVRPRYAVCTACGYEFAGIPIDERGSIICPECAHMNRFDLRVSGAPAYHTMLLSVLWAVVALGILIACTMVAGHMMSAGYSTTASLLVWALLVGGAVLGVLFLVRVLRTRG